MTFMKHVLITILMLHGATNLSAQTTLSTTNEEQYKNEIRQKFALDYSMPDYSVKKIDEGKMGSHLANILRDFEKKGTQGTLATWITSIVSEQNESIKSLYVELKKLKLINVSKTGNELTIRYNVTLNAPAGQANHADLVFHFLDGVSESQSVNEMFSFICRYVNAREKLNK